MSRGEIVVKLFQSLVDLLKAVLPAFLAWHVQPPKYMTRTPGKEEGQGHD